MNNIEIIGYLATIIISIQLAPQLMKAWKTKSTKDISILWNLIYIIGLILWLIYGIGIYSFPLIISSALEFLMAFGLIILKLKFG